MSIIALSLPQEDCNQLPYGSYLPGLCESHDIYAITAPWEIFQKTVKDHNIFDYALQIYG